MFKIIMGKAMLPELATPDWMREKLHDLGHTPGTQGWAQARIQLYRVRTATSCCRLSIWLRYRLQAVTCCTAL